MKRELRDILACPVCKGELRWTRKFGQVVKREFLFQGTLSENGTVSGEKVIGVYSMVFVFAVIRL
jgi:uncharacterized protein YbaR (Trm112 family)